MGLLPSGLRICRVFHRILRLSFTQVPVAISPVHASSRLVSVFVVLLVCISLFVGHSIVSSWLNTKLILPINIRIQNTRAIALLNVEIFN